VREKAIGKVFRTGSIPRNKKTTLTVGPINVALFFKFAWQRINTHNESMIPMDSTHINGTLPNSGTENLRVRSERNVLRGLVQMPLDAWPQASVLRPADFLHYSAGFETIAFLITSYLKDGLRPVMSQAVLSSDIGIGADLAAELFEVAHVSTFTDGLAAVLNRPLMNGELMRIGKVANRCESIAESDAGIADEVVVRSFAGIDASELSSYATQEADWLVQDVFTIDEPLLVGARSKGCKTLQLTDLAVAVTSGTPWMNAFEVPKRRKVLFITGEANYRRIAKHIDKACRVRGLDFNDLTGFLRIEAVDFPCLPRLADQESIRADIERHEIDVVVIDPLYRGLSGLDSSRLSEMGDAIKSFQAACQPACMVLSHHVIKSAAREYGNPPQLEDMTGAGIAESCGQWWLVGRNTKYEWDWKHDLCVQYGGREGQGGGRRILFNEYDWTFQVDAWHEYTQQAREEVVQRRHEARLEGDERKRAAARMLILKAVRNVKTPQSKSSIRESCGAVQSDFRIVFPELLQEMTLVQRPYRDALNRLQAVGYLLKDYVAEYDKKEADAVEKQITQEMVVDAG